MSRRRKKATLARGYPGMNNPGGSMMIVSPQQLQSIFGQTFYGSKASIPTQDATMFSPGVPLVPQPGVNKGGMPVQYQFPIAYNSFPVDRSQGKPDIPSFQQLRTVAKLYSGITLCERAWFDMVPKMQLKVSLHPDLVAQGYEEKDYQKEISFFREKFEKPDGRRDIHTWLRMALREQTQIDELYIYKHRKRNGDLLGLHIIAGDTMKPLLNDWGDIPLPSDPDPFAYQQYPWGIPGMQYTTDMMVHYQESPAADTPYGQSRVERVLMEVNQALRKKRRDLDMFTQGNIPAAIIEVPESPMWTPDQIDAFEQSWNALVAGNPQQQVRAKFMQPGMKYVKLDNGEILTEFDMFLLNITTGCYGMSLQDLSFTGDIHKSSGDSQQNVMYRRTIDPLAIIYGFILTDCMHHDFPDELHGEMFIVSFGGFEEAEDLGSLATAYTTLTGAGILGLTNAGKLMKLPEDPDAPHIGRVLITATGPIFLDDMASDEMRNAAQQAQLAGYKMAANPPAPGENAPGDEKEPGESGNIPPKGEKSGGNTQPQQAQKAQQKDTQDPEKSTKERALVSDLDRSGDTTEEHDAREDYKRWRQRALDDVKAGKTQRGFTTTTIPEPLHRMISTSLARCSTPDEVRRTFQRAQEVDANLEPLLDYNPQHDAWEPFDTDQQLADMKARGVKRLKWASLKSFKGSCDKCIPNEGQIVELGQPFKSGARLAPQHPNCLCETEEIVE